MASRRLSASARRSRSVLRCGDRNATLTVNRSALIVVTEWREFKSPDFEHIRSTLKQPVIFDGRNLFDPWLLQSLGIEYFGVGRGNAAVTKQQSEAPGNVR